MRFNDIPGHSALKQRLVNLADGGKLPHALIFEGAEGIGKLALARAFAAYIHCENPTPDGDSCGVCPSCRQHLSLNHIDTIYAFPVIKKNATGPNISDDFVDDWRGFLKESMFADIERWTEILNRSKSNTKPMIYVDESKNLIQRLSYATRGSRYKIVVMWLPELLHENASNKLLKIIEEPYPDTLFLLVSNNSAAILPTIYSRLQRVRVDRYSDSDIAGWLAKEYAVDENEALAVAHIADGSMINAVRLLSQSSSRARNFELFKQLMRLAYTRDVKKLRDWAYELAAEGRDKEISFYEFAMRLIRENFIYNFNSPELNYLNSEEEAFSRNFARFISENNVEGIMSVFQQALIDIEGNANGKMVNLDVAISIILLIKNF